MLEWSYVFNCLSISESGHGPQTSSPVKCMPRTRIYPLLSSPMPFIAHWEKGEKGEDGRGEELSQGRGQLGC